MSDPTKHNGSSKKPDATTSDTTVKLKVTEDAKESADETIGNATAYDTNQDGTEESEPVVVALRNEVVQNDELAKTLLGKLLVGTYLVEREIDRSSPKRVFEGTDIRTDSKVAVVILPPPEFIPNKKRASSLPKKLPLSTRDESARSQLEKLTGIKVHAYECHESFSYCVISLESLDEFENPPDRSSRNPEASTSKKASSLATIATILLFTSTVGFGFLQISRSNQTIDNHQPVRVSNLETPERLAVRLTNDSDLNPTNDFIAFDNTFVDGFSPTGSIDMTGINRVVAQSVIVSLNARDINTNSAVFHAQCVAAAAKNVARSLRNTIVQNSQDCQFIDAKTGSPTTVSARFTRTPCYVGETHSSNVYFPTALTSAMAVSYPSSLKSQSAGGRRRNGDAYMAGYSKIRVPIGDTTIDIAGVPVFPLRTSDLLTIDDIKESKDTDPINSDYLPANSILVGSGNSKYDDLVACTVFGAADKDYPACIPRGYIRITNGPQHSDNAVESAINGCPVSESKNDSFVDDWEPAFPWLDTSKSSEPRVFHQTQKRKIPWFIDYRFTSEQALDKVKTSEGLVGPPLALLDQIGQNNAACEESILQRITAKLKQVDPNITVSEVKAALNQGKLSYAGEPLFLYSSGPGGKLQCDNVGFPYMSNTVPNDGKNSAVEFSCDRQFSIRAEDEEHKVVTVVGTERAVFTPATGWRNLLGDISFEYETTDSGTFSQP